MINSTNATKTNFYSANQMAGSNLSDDLVNKQREAQYGGTKSVVGHQAGAIFKEASAKYLEHSDRSADLQEEIDNLQTELDTYKKKNPCWDWDPSGSAQGHAARLETKKRKLMAKKANHDNVAAKNDKRADDQAAVEKKATDLNATTSPHNSVLNNNPGAFLHQYALPVSFNY